MIRRLFMPFLFALVANAALAITLENATDISEDARLEAREFLRANPRRRIGCIADTKSMLPTLSADFIVILEPKPYSDLRCEDIVAFVADWAPTAVVHRLVRRTSNGWATKGDRLFREDPTEFTRNNYAGAVVIAAIHKRTGRVVTTL